MPSNILKPVFLKNGMTVVRYPRSGASSFVIGFAVKTGSSVELDNFPLGISMFVERMFWKGTDKHPSLKALNQTLEGIGGEFYSHTGREITQYYIRVPYYHQHKAISMLAEIIQHSYFQDYDIENEKKKILDELRNSEEISLPDSIDLSLQTTFNGHGLGTAITGTIESILTITVEHIIEYLAHQYNPKNCYLILSGNFDSKSTMELLEQEWTLWSPRSLEKILPESINKENLGKLPKTDFRQRGIPRTMLGLSFILEGGLTPVFDENETIPPEPEITQDVLTDWAKLLVLSTLLGQGLSSRLWTKCVEEEMFFHSISSQLVLFEHTGLLHIGGVIVEGSQFSFSLESILATLEALKKTTISINEFTKAKEYLKGRLTLENEDILASTIWHVEIMLISGLLLTKEDLLDYINKVDAHAIRSLAMDLFVPERMSLVTMGTAKLSPVISKLFKKYLSPSPY